MTVVITKLRDVWLPPRSVSLQERVDSAKYDMVTGVTIPQDWCAPHAAGLAPLELVCFGVETTDMQAMDWVEKKRVWLADQCDLLAVGAHFFLRGLLLPYAKIVQLDTRDKFGLTRGSWLYKSCTTRGLAMNHCVPRLRESYALLIRLQS